MPGSAEQTFTTRPLARFDPRRLLQVPEIYKSFVNVIGAHTAMIRFVQDFVRVVPGDRLLDLGCGPGRLLPYLPEVDYIGVDLDDRYLAHARRQYDAAKARFYQLDLSQDCSHFSDGGFDIAVAIGLIHHIPDDGAARLINFAREQLKPGGRLVTLDCVFTPEQSKAARFVVSLDRGEHVRTPKSYLDLVRGRFPQTDITILHDMLRIPYTHAILTCVR
jgi:cyclopropane fatty-acyl-phospholipid synthase-like methyltransferase